MAIIVEDGSGKPDAEAYCDVAFADAYHLKRMNSAWSALTEQNKEACLIKATDFISQRYNGRWRGMRRLTTQALDWPRVGVTLDDFQQYATYGNVEVSYEIVPEEVMKACAELALRAIGSDLNPDLSQGVVRETVGPLTVQYDVNSSRSPSYLVIGQLLSRYLSGSATRTKLVRV